MKTTLLFCHHGVLQDTPNGALHINCEPETTLSAFGIEQMELIGVNLSGNSENHPGAIRPGVIISSPDPWIVDSAKIVARHFSAGESIVEVDPELSCRNWGDYNGHRWVDVQKILDEMAIDERFKWRPSGGESGYEYELRSKAAVQRIVKRFPAETVCIFGRGSLLRAILHPICGIPRNLTVGVYPQYGEVTMIKVDDEASGDDNVLVSVVDFHYSRFFTSPKTSMSTLGG